MRIPLLVVRLLLFYGLWACGSSDRKTADQASPADTAQLTVPGAAAEPDASAELTGLLQTSGLQPDEATALGIRNGKFQLISQTPYFLEGPDSLKAYLGQCLKVRGKVAPAWEDSPDQLGAQTTYGRKLFLIEGIEVQPAGLCFYSDSTLMQPQGREVTYNGQVERMQRPAPDISYDYQLRLQKPYRDANNPVQPGKLVQSLPLVSGDFGILNALEQAVQQKSQMRIQGVQHKGYAESEALWVVRADSLAI